MSRNLTECGCGPLIGEIRNGLSYPYGTVAAEKYNEDITALQNQISALAGKEADDINALNVKIANQSANISAFKAEVSDQVNTIQTGLALAERDIEELKKSVERSFATAEAASQKVNSLEVVLATVRNQHMNDVNNLTDRINSLESMRSDIQALNERVARLENSDKSEIISFIASPNICERGGTENVVLTWTIKGNPVLVTLDGIPVEGNQCTVENVQNPTEFVLSVTDANGYNTSKTVSVSFVNHIYWGISFNPEVNRQVVKSLAYTDFSDDVVRDITINNIPEAYVIYAYPKRLGRVDFKVGPFVGGFEEPITIGVDNHSEYMEDYYVYRSSQQLIGTLELSVIRAE